MLRTDEEIEDAIEANSQLRSREDCKEGVKAFFNTAAPTGPLESDGFRVQT